MNAAAKRLLTTALLTVVGSSGCNAILGLDEGQTLCDATWAHWTPDFEPNYETTSNSALETTTRLRWTRRPSGVMTFEKAKAVCEEATIDGEDDYRLPTRIELLSLIDYNRERPIDRGIFLIGEGDRIPIWTASAPKNKPLAVGGATPLNDYRLTVDVASGQVVAVDPALAASVYQSLCVRVEGVKIAEKTNGCADRYVSEEGGAVLLDRETGLRWEEGGEDDEAPTWQDAETRCNGLSLAGGGWFLPTVIELSTLVDEASAEGRPAIDTRFKGRGFNYWSSTQDASRPGQKWAVSFYNGVVSSVSETGSDAPPEEIPRVRCVRR
ncbi:DUF1566 domain-containing protein [Chondromyces crocatus]|uniref:Lcl C-terminal domain-containing protein n=1 Tax=Chondromyces crocatus TaxID=52 RepID=A0A0K1EI47_CHOCO|nr:DUF1566 domain-containing protein [Chondromyces crocatus]AKT40541.1 uncharacterized protein CMC5_046960 [Chondromyces crocatus]